jgi:hypothetical protein
MSSTVGELIVNRVDGEIVVERADQLIYATDELLAELDPDARNGHFDMGTVRYRVVGRSVVYPGSMLCERVR